MRFGRGGACGDRACSCGWRTTGCCSFVLFAAVGEGCGAGFEKELEDGFAVDLEGSAGVGFPGGDGDHEFLLELNGHVSTAHGAQTGMLTLGFSFLTRLRIFSSRSSRPGSRAPRPVKRETSAADAASSFSSSHISNQRLMLPSR